MHKQQRQGDLLFESRKQRPKGAKPSERERGETLAYGEVSGHSHAVVSHKRLPDDRRLSDDDVAHYESVVDENGNIWVYANTPIVVAHGTARQLEVVRERMAAGKFGDDLYDLATDHVDSDHKPITLEANYWHNVVRQREYDPAAANRERQVRD